MNPLVVLPAILFLQDSSLTTATTPFRQGQWAAQFQAGTSFGSLGFIKFRSPTHALVLDLRVTGEHGEASSTDTSGVTRFAALGSDASIQMRLGWRRYAGDGNKTKVVSHYTFGVLTGFDHHVSAAPGGSSQMNGWTAGVFGDIGGTYLLTPKFGIGALGTASIMYSNDVRKSSFGVKSHEWSIGGSAIAASLVATLFF